METTTRYVIRDLVGENCITLDDGQTIYDLIHPRLQAGHSVELDFEGVKIVVSPFLNAAIGQLLRDLSPDDLNAHLKITNLSVLARPVLQRVIANAKEYYSDPAVRKAVDEVMGEIAAEDGDES
jgi:hypothetical protein